MNSKDRIVELVDSKKDFFAKVSDDVWSTPELGFLEFKSAATLEKALEEQGFKVEKGLAGIETAFKGTYGSGKPVFGICRGHQLINVYFGGSLYQDHPLAESHRWDRINQADRVHMNISEEGSFIHALYGKNFSTNSAHHQAVKQLGKGLHICRYSDDGIPEGLKP